MTPEEIQAKEFLTGVRGYLRHEVESFLSAVADELRRKDAQIAALKNAIDVKEFTQRDAILSSMGTEVTGVVRAAHDLARALKTQAAEEITVARQSVAMFTAELRNSRALLDDVLRRLERIDEVRPADSSAEPFVEELRDARASLDVVLNRLMSTAEVLDDAPLRSIPLQAGRAPAMATH